MYLTACVAVVIASPVPEVESEAKTLSQSLVINPGGSYAYDYQTSNGIAAKADADDRNTVNGEYSYPNADGSEVKVAYKAGEGIGFMPLEGVHPAIIKALQYIIDHPPVEGPQLDVRMED